MLSPKSFRLLALLLGGMIMLAACGGQPSAPAPASAAPTAVPAEAQPPAAPTSAPTPKPVDTPLPTVAAPTAAPQPTVTSTPSTETAAGASALARGALTQRPIIVMIDNHPEAYPQTGLDHAAVVFEALAEFGVTRFMAVYAPGITPNTLLIGPVRSTRLYFAQWAMGFHALYAHAGGSPEGLELVESTDQLINLDALKDASSIYFRRDNDRDAPHNLYTSSASLQQAAQTLGVADLAHPELGFLFKNDAPKQQRPAAQQIDYFFIYREDNAGWSYDSSTNGYLRLRRGKPARDAATDQQLWAKDVVVLEIQEAPIPGDPKGRIDQNVIGSGRARVFMDGIEREVTWRKEAPEAPLRFFDDASTETRLNAGPVWIVALPSLNNLTVK
ncbi:MAG TPA: DUF3048 domain-containing protein [Roseiflexaceae bacterium]|nr:DUF3048 domain-containing protein [Roseiflexaceae bacterium]